MAGWLTNGFPQNAPFTGDEQLPLDTLLGSGAVPQSSMSNLMQLATALKWLASSIDRTTVAGSRYYGSVSLPGGIQLTGIELLVGGTGGTDLWIVELHDADGALVATSTTDGTTAGTANEWQRIAFTAAYDVPEDGAGTYFIAVQSNGTTAKPAVYSSTGLPILSGSATGVFATSAAITPPTTYTVDLAPVAQVY